MSSATLTSHWYYLGRLSMAVALHAKKTAAREALDELLESRVLDDVAPNVAADLRKELKK